MYILCQSVGLSVCQSVGVCLSVCLLTKNIYPAAHSGDCLHTARGVKQSVACQSVSLSVCQSVSLSVCQSVSLSVCQSVSLSVCQSVSLSVCQSVSLSVCQSVSLSVCQSVSLSVCQSVGVCLSVCRQKILKYLLNGRFTPSAASLRRTYLDNNTQGAL